MESSSYSNIDCISKYSLLQEICGFNDGPLVNEDSVFSEKTIRLSVMGKVTGFIVRTDTPHSKVTHKINGHIHSEVVSDENNNAIFDCVVDFDRIHCSQVVSDANLLQLTLLPKGSSDLLRHE